MIGKQIKKARLLAGLTQKQLGDMLAKGVSTISEWESGKRSPEVELIPKMSKILDVSNAFLLDLTDDPHGDQRLPDLRSIFDAEDVELLSAYHSAEDWQIKAVRAILNMKGDE